MPSLTGFRGSRARTNPTLAHTKNKLFRICQELQYIIKFFLHSKLQISMRPINMERNHP